MPKLCSNITFPHQQDFFPIRSVTKSSTARFSHENLVEKFKIFVQDFVPIRTALMVLTILLLFISIWRLDSPDDCKKTKPCLLPCQYVLCYSSVVHRLKQSVLFYFYFSAVPRTLTAGTSLLHYYYCSS